jgi:NTP pyrophosphatase (non-canonical NTP hydrolase)
VIDSNSSLEDFQARNDAVYRQVNDRHYSAERMFARLHRHITHVLKAVRKGEQEKRPEAYEHIMYHLCMAFSWSLSMLNRYHINLADDMWRRFPGVCPYCGEAPCCCKKRPKDRQKLVGKTRGQQPISFRDWQKMFAEVYPNIVLVSAIHLAEEAGEVNEALHAHSATHQDDNFWKIVEELVDVVTNIFGVANCLKLDLAAGMAAYFSDGCPRCKKPVCECGFVLSDKPIALKAGPTSELKAKQGQLFT